MPDSPTIHVNEAVDRLSKLVLDEYVETDETIGPRVREFEQSEQQLQMLGQQITAMRDAASSQFEAHTQLIELAGITADPHLSIPSVRAYGERQEGLAALSKTLAAHYDRFVNLSVNQLEGLAGVVANKYKAYTKKVVEMRRRKAQLQLLNKQKERSDLRTLERSLIPPQGTGGPSAAFHIDLEGTLVKQSTTTRLWWSTYARLDVKKKVLLFTSRQSEPPSAASKAVALSKYVLCHELPEHHARRAAAFELVPLLPDLPVVTLAADGTMMSRKWVVALQEAIDHVEDGESDGTAVAATPSNGSGGPQTPAGETPAAGASTPGSAVPEASPLRAIGMKLEQMVDYASKNIDELDRNFSGTLAEQSQRTQIQLAQLGEEKDVVGETVLIAIDDFSKAMASQMSEELLRIAQAELDYHSGMAAQMQQLVVTLKRRQGAAAPSAQPVEAVPVPPPKPPPAAKVEPPPKPMVEAAPIEASLAPPDLTDTPPPELPKVVAEPSPPPPPMQEQEPQQEAAEEEVVEDAEEPAPEPEPPEPPEPPTEPDSAPGTELPLTGGGEIVD